MSKIARSIGLDPDQAQHIDVVAALFYAALSRSLLRAATGNGRADDKLVGVLQVLLRALDPAELRISGPDGGPIPIAAVVANVQSALGMRPGTAELRTQRRKHALPFWPESSRRHGTRRSRRGPPCGDGRDRVDVRAGSASLATELIVLPNGR